MLPNSLTIQMEEAHRMLREEEMQYRPAFNHSSKVLVRLDNKKAVSHPKSLIQGIHYQTLYSLSKWDKQLGPKTTLVIVSNRQPVRLQPLKLRIDQVTHRYR